MTTKEKYSPKVFDAAFKASRYRLCLLIWFFFTFARVRVSCFTFPFLSVTEHFPTWTIYSRRVGVIVVVRHGSCLTHQPIPRVFRREPFFPLIFYY